MSKTFNTVLRDPVSDMKRAVSSASWIILYSLELILILLILLLSLMAIARIPTTSRNRSALKWQLCHIPIWGLKKELEYSLLVTQVLMFVYSVLRQFLKKGPKLKPSRHFIKKDHCTMSKAFSKSRNIIIPAMLKTSNFHYI